MEFPAELAAHRAALLKLVKPSATFEAYPAPAGLDIKSSKMGGVPFNPIYTDWPSSMVPDGHLTTKKRPQTFVGQFNFAEIVAAVPELLTSVPEKGLLQFFYDLEEGTWGSEYPKDLNFFTVAWYPDVDRMDHVPPEAPIPSYPEKEFALRFSYRLSLPETPYLPDDIELDEDEEEAYDEAFMHDVHHQIGGYPIPIQNDPMENLSFAHNDDGGWQCLLQIDSDKTMNVMWFDQGTIYLGIKTNDLKNANPAYARMNLQCM